MSIDDCIEAYANIFDRVLTKKRVRHVVRNRVHHMFDTAEFEWAIKDVMYKQIARKRSTENMLLRDGNGLNVPCKV